MFFNLNGECYFVKGLFKGVIYNLYTKSMVELQQEESKLMLQILQGAPCDESAFLKELVDKGWGFFSEKRYYIDKLRPYNQMMLVRHDLRPPVPEVAFLQLTNQCSCSVETCRKMFCSPCRTDGAELPCLSIDEWKQIIGKLYVAGVRQIILTGGDVTRCEILPQY